MRSILPKVTAALAVLFIALLLVTPAASAQDGEGYGNLGPGEANCNAMAAPTIGLVGSNIQVDFPQGALDCITNVTVGANSELYNGPVPTSGTLFIAVPANASAGDIATVSATYTSGPVRTASVAVSAAAITALNTVSSSALPGPAAAPAASADEVAGVSITAQSATPASPPLALQPAVASDLAFTGSSVSLPLAAAAGLLGAGAITLLAARKREQSA